MASPPIPEETRADQTAPQRSGSPIASPPRVDINQETGKRQEENFPTEVESKSDLAGPFSRFSLNEDRSQRSDADEYNSEKEEQHGDTPHAAGVSSLPLKTPLEEQTKGSENQLLAPAGTRLQVTKQHNDVEEQESTQFHGKESGTPGVLPEFDHNEPVTKEFVWRVYEKQREEFQKKIDSLVKVYETQLKEKERDLQDCNKKIKELKEENEKLRRQAESTTAELQAKTIEASELKSKNEDLMTNEKELRKKLTQKGKLERELEDLRIRLSEAEQERTRERAEAEKKLGEVEKERTRERAEAEKKLGKVEKSLNKTKRKLAEAEEKLAEKERNEQVNMFEQLKRHTEDQHKEQMKEFRKIQDGVKGIQEDMKANRTYEVNFSSKYWGLDKQDEQFSGKDVLIAVLDTGVNEYHKALQRIAIGAQSCPVVIDKRNFVTEKNGECKRDACKDTHENSHGTSVAGVVAGSHLSIAHFPELKGKYRYGSSKNELFNLPLGVASKASLLVCRVANGNAAPEYVAAALKWIHDHNSIVKGEVEMTAAHEECKLGHDNEEKNRIRIVSMSFRLPNDDRAVKTQIDNLNQQNVICIAGLGNEGHNASPGWPARYHNVISVGSVDYSGGTSKFSNRFNEHIDVYAPGEDVLVAKNTGMCSGHQSNVTCVPLPPPLPPIPSEQNAETDTGVDIDMGVLAADSGTSFAAPAVAGLIAILVQWARLKDRARLQDKPRLVDSITRFDNLMKLLRKHMIVEIDGVPNAWLLQPEKIKIFFKEKIEHLDVLMEELD